jgi:hypothetical protein
VEERTGKDLSTLMRELVFEPLAMRDSGFAWLPAYERTKVYGHTAAGTVAVRRRPVAASLPMLHTTVLDYGRFVAAIMNGTGLRAATHRTMLTPQIRVNESCHNCLRTPTGPLSSSLSWGLGWGLERTARGVAFWHWGENNGEFQTFAMGYPDGDGVVIFTNSGNGFSIIPDLVEVALPGDHPAFAWMGYEHHTAPSKRLLRDILAGGVAAVTDDRTKEIPEPRLNAMGYQLLERKRLPEAVAVFTLVTRRFPRSSNAYDSLGEAYAAIGERQKAIASYETSLRLDPGNTNAKEMLRRLRGPNP